MNRDQVYIPDIRLAELLSLEDSAEGAFRELFYRYSERVYAYVLSIAKERYIAEEVTQTVFVKLWNSRSLIDRERSLKSLLFAIAYNETVSLFRRQRAEKSKIAKFLSLNLSDVTNDTEYKIEFENLHEVIESVVCTLPERRQAIYRLSREAGLSNRDIAEKLGISVKTVENSMTAVLRTLRTKLEIRDADNSGCMLLLFTLFFT